MCRYSHIYIADVQMWFLDSIGNILEREKPAHATTRRLFQRSTPGGRISTVRRASGAGSIVKQSSSCLPSSVRVLRKSQDY